MKKLLLLLFIPGLLYSQGMIINEISNGASGNQEYYELLVIGSSANPLANVNLSGWIIDDNNGAFEGVMTGVGIAQGHIRIAASCLTSVKPGSIIVIYNSAELSFTPDELDSNSDCIYFIPINSTCLDNTNSLPTSSNSNYFPSVYSSAKIWDRISLANSGDAAQVRKPDGSFYYGFSYGDISAPFPNFPIELGGGSSFNVRTGDGTSRNYFLGCGSITSVTSFTRGTAPGNETPGLPNNDQNRYLINLIRNGTYDYLNHTNPLNCGSSSTLNGCVTILSTDLNISVEKENWCNKISVVLADKQTAELTLLSSEDGIIFNELSKIQTTNSKLEYLFNDCSETKENYYYAELNNSFSKIIYIKNFEEEIRIFPNPTSGRLNILGSKAKTATLYTLLGELISTVEIKNNSIELNVVSGSYYLIVDNKVHPILIVR